MLGFRMNWTAAMRSDPTRPIGGEVKVAVLLRHHEPMWRSVHYMEAPLGPLPFVRLAYQRAADPDLLDPER